MATAERIYNDHLSTAQLEQLLACQELTNEQIAAEIRALASVTATHPEKAGSERAEKALSYLFAGQTLVSGTASTTNTSESHVTEFYAGCGTPDKKLHLVAQSAYERVLLKQENLPYVDIYGQSVKRIYQGPGGAILKIAGVYADSTDMSPAIDCGATVFVDAEHALKYLSVEASPAAGV